MIEKDIAKKAENIRPVDYAIKVNGVSKTFRIPHEKISSLRGAFVSAFSRDKGYEEFQALDDVSFSVKKGEFFGIIGRNGSGKSTLLKILAGIYQPDKGKVKVNGLISPFLELGIGFNPELSGRDNIYLNSAVLGLTHKQIDEKFQDIVNFSELGRFIDQKVKNYSSGMYVRLAFSVAIHANRDILLMDEVLAVGDTNFQQKCISEFTKYKHLGKTVILVTHDILTVQKYCDRAMLLREGKIQILGKPDKVGNEYIYQNMEDDEKRLFDEEKLRRQKAEKEIEKRKQEEKLAEEDLKCGKSEERMTQSDMDKIKEVKIEKVELIGPEGKTIARVKLNEVVRLRFHINFFIDSKNYNAGFICKDSDGRNVFGARTAELISQLPAKKKGDKCVVDFVFINKLNTGAYTFAVAVSDKKYLKKQIYYHWIENALTFSSICPPETVWGAVHESMKEITIK